MSDTESSLLPTPRASEPGSTSPGYGDSLNDVAQRFVIGFARKDLLPTPTVFHTTMHDEPIDYFLEREARSSTGQIGKSLGVALRMELLRTPAATEAERGHQPPDVARARGGQVTLSGQASFDDWNKFGPAIKRWEETTRLQAPDPTLPDGKDGNIRLNPEFAEWMMGLAKGWITNCGLTRKEALKAAGNGVVPQQAEMALNLLFAYEVLE
jgi:DNA (cytosine-5)-methyltransferase 1